MIDFDEFKGMCIDKKVLKNEDDLKNAFQILDFNGDGNISLEDFDKLYSADKGSSFDQTVW